MVELCLHSAHGDGSAAAKVLAKFKKWGGAVITAVLLAIAGLAAWRGLRRKGDYCALCSCSGCPGHCGKRYRKRDLGRVRNLDIDEFHEFARRESFGSPR